MENEFKLRKDEQLYWTIRVTQLNGKFIVSMDNKRVFDSVTADDSIEAISEFTEALNNGKIDY